MRDVATRLAIPVPATDMLAAGLAESDFVTIDQTSGLIRLRGRLAALGLAYLEASGITDLVQPILDDLAKRTGELLRLAVVEGDRLTWVAKSHSTRSGLFYTPDTGTEVYLPATANGQAWLACLPNSEVQRLVEKQGLEKAGVGPNAPDDIHVLRLQVEKARAQNFATVTEAYEIGTSAIAAAIRRRGYGTPVGTVSVAGPTIRMTASRMAEISPWLLSSAEELGAASASSPLFAVS